MKPRRCPMAAVRKPAMHRGFYFEISSLYTRKGNPMPLFFKTRFGDCATIVLFALPMHSKAPPHQSLQFLPLVIVHAFAKRQEDFTDSR
jgi:hypothetical protein